MTEDNSNTLIHDISLSLTESLPVWPGDPPLSILRLQELARGDTATVSAISMGVHCGTHVDAPAHYLLHGRNVESLPLDRLIGPAQVVEVATNAPVGPALLASLGIADHTRRLLLRTPFSNQTERCSSQFNKDFASLTPDGAAWLCDHDIQLLGLDTPSVGPFNDPLPCHRLLLQADIVVVELLNLAGIRPGFYHFICLPLRLVGLEGSPARAVLIETVS
jgi:arylformamidase